MSGPIAMFDSGFGGLTVARAVIDLLPHHDVVYFGDTGRYPYGTKPAEEVRRHAIEIAQLLADQHEMRLLVVACNTAAAVALDELRALLDVPVVGVIEPGLRAAAEVTRSGRVGVIGTVGTVASGAYEREGARIAPGVDLTVAACPGFVEFVERGETDSEQVHVLAERLLAPVVDAGVDTLLLGCTHYPYLARTITDVMGRDVVLVSSADETAFEIRDRLADTSHEEDRRDATHARGGPGDRPAGTHAPGRTGSHTFISSGDANAFERIGRQLFGEELIGARQHVWDR